MSAAHYWLAALFFVGSYAFWIYKHVGKSLELKLERYIHKPDYEGRTSFIESFHEDFKRVVSAYAGNRKVFIFVDDLDRCDLPRAAELMQAINLMIGEDNHLVFILGLDREKVAAGITLKYKELMPFLKNGAGEDAASARHPSAFGYTYLEKFIQITFRVPRPSESGIQKFLDSMGQSEEELKQAELQKQTEREVRRERRKLIEVRSRADSKEMQTQVKLVAPMLQWNPRRIKQFMNDFRLQAYIASDLGLLDLVSDGEGIEAAKITLEQLGKFVAITMAWPDLVMDLIGFPTLLTAIYERLAAPGREKLGESKTDEPDRLVQADWDQSQSQEPARTRNMPFTSPETWLVNRWSKETNLEALLLANCKREDGARYSLEGTDLQVLLNIAPRAYRGGHGSSATSSGTSYGSGSGATSEATPPPNPPSSQQPYPSYVSQETQQRENPEFDAAE